MDSHPCVSGKEGFVRIQVPRQLKIFLTEFNFWDRYCRLRDNIPNKTWKRKYVIYFFTDQINPIDAQNIFKRFDMNCPNCQGQNPFIAKFCMFCGFSLVVPCNNCNYENVHYAKYCIECGYSIGHAPPKTVPSQSDIHQNSVQKFIPQEHRSLMKNYSCIERLWFNVCE